MQHSLGSKRLGRTGGGGWQAFIIGRDPGGDGCGDGAVVSPTNDEAVVVGGGRIDGGSVGRADRWTTGSCCPWGLWGFVGRLFFGPGVAKPRPGKSSRGGRFVLPANFGDVGQEFILLRLRDGGRSNVTGFVVAVDKAFAADVPASAHKGGVVPLGVILGALAGKMLLPVFAVLQQELGDGGGVLGDAFPVDVS